MSRFLQERANIIIALTSTPMARDSDRPAKIFTDIELFGESTFNPWPDNEDEDSRQKYLVAREKLEAQIRLNFEKILNKIQATPEI